LFQILIYILEPFFASEKGNGLKGSFDGYDQLT